MVLAYSYHSRLRQEQLLKDHAALLMDEVFSVITGIVNMQCGTVSQSGKRKIGRDTSEDKVLESDHLPQVPDMPMAGHSQGH